MAAGYQGVQGMHAAIQFCFENPDHSRQWFEKSNYLGFLSVANEYELHQLIEKAISLDIRFSIFREPDVDNQITAIAIEPGAKSKKLCSNLKLALKEYNK
jgi:hypothetical protein